jgi:ABC-2 type transport system ATP-binding protein
VDRQPDAVRRSIGCVFQKHAVDPEATGRENLLLQGHLYGLRGAALRARAGELADRFGLADAAGRLVPHLVRRHAAQARRRDGAGAPPVGAVPGRADHRARPGGEGDLWAEIGRLARDEGLTVLLTTHYLEEADKLADQLVIVDRGRVVAAGTAEQLKSELRGDALVVELAPPRPSRRCCRASARSRWTAGRCGPGSTTGPCGPGGAGRAGAAGLVADLGDGRPAVAGRRLPPAHRPRLRRRCHPELEGAAR